tara:strand:+ start:62 stop:670 length:609 start_codon:yes stop_codon:yes gene_type:complete
MKILAVGDLEGDFHLAKRLAQKAENEEVDAILLCGDLVDEEENTNGVIAAFSQPVFAVRGNHDGPHVFDFLVERYKLKNLEGYGYNAGTFGFFGCGSVNLGVWQNTESEIFDMLKKGEKSVKGAQIKVLMSHVHPAKSRMSHVSGFEGSHGLRQAIEELQPDLVFCSHVCEAEGIEEKIGNTRVINVGRSGKILDLKSFRKA